MVETRLLSPLPNGFMEPSASKVSEGFKIVIDRRGISWRPSSNHFETNARAEVRTEVPNHSGPQPKGKQPLSLAFRWMKVEKGDACVKSFSTIALLRRAGMSNLEMAGRRENQMKGRKRKL